MQNIAVKFVLLLGLALAAPVLLAEDVAPDVLLSAVTLEVMAIGKHDQYFRVGNPTNLADQVGTKILPLFDVARMTQIAERTQDEVGVPKPVIEWLTWHDSIPCPLGSHNAWRLRSPASPLKAGAFDQIIQSNCAPANRAFRAEVDNYRKDQPPQAPRRNFRT